MEPTESEGKSKWHGRLMVLFLILFAFFWSLGPFFFWVLGSMAAYFGFMALYNSGIKFTAFDRPAGRPDSRSRYSNPSATANPEATPSFKDPVLVLRKVIRVSLISFAAMVLFFFIIGIFSNNDEDNSTSVVDSTGSNEVATSTPMDADQATAWTDKGNELFSKQEYDSALKYYDKVLAQNPENQYGLYNKSLVFFMKKDYRKSISLIKKCLRLYPDYNVGWWLLGDDYSEMNNLDSAVICLERAYNDNYSEPDFLELMAEVYLKKGDRAKAKEFYLMVLAKNTTNAKVYRELAELDPSNAEEYRKKATELEQNSK